MEGATAPPEAAAAALSPKAGGVCSGKLRSSPPAGAQRSPRSCPWQESLARLPAEPGVVMMTYANVSALLANPP